MPSLLGLGWGLELLTGDVSEPTWKSCWSQRLLSQPSGKAGAPQLQQDAGEGEPVYPGVWRHPEPLLQPSGHWWGTETALLKCDPAELSECV